MIALSDYTIDKSCKVIRECFPCTFILRVFKDITSDQDLANFPEVKTSEDKIKSTIRSGTKISLKAVDEMSDYFCENQERFLVFLKSLTNQTMGYYVIDKISLDDFISKVSVLLFEDSKIKIENFEIVQWVPNNAGKEIFLNIDVPDYIQDYFSESLDCLSHGLHRSSILFCAIALEASLRYKYLELRGATNITFNKLIDWAIKQKLIEDIYAERENLNFIRNYRNDLVHFNINKKDAKLKISRNYAQQNANIIVHLVENFINQIFC